MTSRGGRRREDIELKDSDDDDDEARGLDAGRRKVKKVHDPKSPDEEEVREHFLSGHVPYRSWCHHCVRGRKRERDHTKKGEETARG